MVDKKSILDQKVAILKGIAHPVRLAVVEALADSEMCVCDIAEMFHFD
ncbi:MAG: ArsR/SmtB family transcription factor, partial [Synergistaceae bacterium]